MRRIRTIATVAMMSAALFGASGAIASAAPGPTYRDEADVTPLTNDGPLVANQTYHLSYNSSGTEGGKVSGGFTLSGPNNVFLGGKTELICQDADGATRIINRLNPPKKGGSPDYEWLVIRIENGIETVDVVPFTEPDPTC